MFLRYKILHQLLRILIINYIKCKYIIKCIVCFKNLLMHLLFTYIMVGVITYNIYSYNY